MIQLDFPVNLLFLFTVIFTLNATPLTRMKDKRIDHPETAFKTMKQRLLYDSQFEQNKYYAVGNPYILACNSSSQCQDTSLKECSEIIPQDPNTWFCNCWCDGFGPCKTNRDCCNNNCIKGICSNNGGTQGTVCSGSCASCAPEYQCQPWPYYWNSGFCNYQGNTTHLSTTSENLSSKSTTPTLTTTYSDPCIEYDCGPGTCVPNEDDPTQPSCLCPECTGGKNCEIDNTNPNGCNSLPKDFCVDYPNTCCYWPCSTSPPTCTESACSSTTVSSTITTYIDPCIEYYCGNGTCVPSEDDPTQPSCLCPECTGGKNCEIDNTNPNGCNSLPKDFCVDYPNTCCYWPCSTSPPNCIACSSSFYS